MRFSASITLLLALSSLCGCNAFSRYGQSSQQIDVPPAVYCPPGGVNTVGPGVVGGVPGAVVLPDGVSPGAVVEGGPVVVPQNNVVVPVVNPDFVWDQVVDVVDDDFEIEREDRVKQVGGIMTEGSIDTFPLTGATLLEPWRRDSVGWDERLESTLQSIRRRAFVRVVPDPSGYLVDVTVIKELEDVPRPEKATAGAATFRYDTSLERDTEFATDPYRIPGDPARPNGPRTLTAGWIPLGRDPKLEQKMLAKIKERLGGTMTAGTATTYTPPPVETPNLIMPQTIPPGTIAPPGTPPGPVLYPPADDTLPPPA
jgi:hypothetical protein